MTTDSFLRLFLLVCLVSFRSEECSGAKILVVGDSMAEMAAQSLESFCGGSTVSNAGIGGTTAEDWAEYEAEDVLSECGSGWDAVYISVGGNDLLGSGCTMAANELKARIERAIEHIVVNLAPSASSYVVTGYCVPASPEDDGDGCSAPSDFAALSSALAELAPKLPASANLRVTDSLETCGGSLSSFSDAGFFQDPIHLNAKGYCKVFSQPSVQQSLACSPANDAIDNDCMFLDGDELDGMEQNCFHGDSSSDWDSSSNEDSASEEDSSGLSTASREGLFRLLGLGMAVAPVLFL